MKRDYYDILEVPRGAEADQIKAAYRKLARQYHPDVNKSSDADERFAEVQEAYDVLSDPDRRSAYDRFGHQAAGHGTRQGEPHYSWSNVAGGGGGFGRDGFDIGSMFEDLFGGAGVHGHGGFGRSARTHSAPARGGDISQEITIDFMEAVKGCRKSLRINRGGTTQTIDVTVPRGMADGKRLRIRGSGAPSRGSGPPGDLLLRVRVREHAHFARDGLDLAIEVPVSIAEATLGATVEIPTLHGSATLTVPAGVNAGRRLRLRGQGITDEKGQTGDLFAIIRIVTTDQLSEKDRDALRDIGTRLPNPRADWNRSGD